jgi:hypothetical protein
LYASITLFPLRNEHISAGIIITHLLIIATARDFKNSSTSSKNELQGSPTEAYRKPSGSLKEAQGSP